MIAVELAALAAALLALCVALRHAPLATLAVLGCAGAFTGGQILLPGQTARRVDDARADVRSWQDRQVAGAVCHIRATQALTAGDNRLIEGAAQACGITSPVGVNSSPATAPSPTAP